MSAPTWGQTTPNLDTFREIAATGARVIPVVRRVLADDTTPVGLYRTLAHGTPGSFILESADAAGGWARWSFVGVASRAQLTSVDGQAHWIGDVPAGIPTSGDVVDVLDATLRTLATAPSEQTIFGEGLPPLTGGMAGTLGWEIVRHWEPTLRSDSPDELGAPELALCLATDLVAIDHHTGSVWLIANAINMDGSNERVEWAHADAVERLNAIEARLAAGGPRITSVVDEAASEPTLEFRTDQATFEAAVAKAKQAIIDGEVFQVVLSQRIDLECSADPLDVYRALRTINPSPYMYYFHLADSRPGLNADDASATDFYVVGASPETLIKVDHGHVTTYPIAGSRPRGVTVEDDVALAEGLLKDPKELSEHVMLVDLSRNDLTKVCWPESVEVVEFIKLRRFSHVMHLCSTVVGQLRADTTALDAYRATFPAGTLSGSPKPRAIALIDELEPAARGVYGGTVGYFDFGGNLDMAIAIRTAFIKHGRASVQAGAGIVADSVPTSEWEESRNKAAAAVRAVQLATRLRPLPGSFASGQAEKPDASDQYADAP